MTNLGTAIITTLVTLVSEVEASANETLSRVFFTFSGRRYELTRFRAGRVEVYEYAPGEAIASWVGYLDEVVAHLPCLHGRAIAEGCAVLQAVHERHWATYLPGADTWAQPRF